MHFIGCVVLCVAGLLTQTRMNETREGNQIKEGNTRSALQRHHVQKQSSVSAGRSLSKKDELQILL